MSEQLFDNSPAVTTPPAEKQDIPSASNYADLLSQIKNERGEQKYATLEEAIKGLANAQEYIPQVKSQLSEKDAELERLRAELEKRKTVEEVIASLKPQQPEERVVEPTSQPSQGLNEETVRELVQRQYLQQKAAEVQQTNITKVRQALVSKYGDKAKEMTEARVSELGMSMDMLNNLCASSPDAALALLNATQAHPATSAPVRSSVSLPDSQRIVSLAPEKSMLSGASDKDRIAYIKKIKEALLEQHGLTQG